MVAGSKEKSKKTAASTTKPQVQEPQSVLNFSTSTDSFDPKLASLFSPSVSGTSFARKNKVGTSSHKPASKSDNSERGSNDPSQSDESADSTSDSEAADSESSRSGSSSVSVQSETEKQQAEEEQQAPENDRSHEDEVSKASPEHSRRKRKRDDEGLESRYLQKLAREEEEENTKLHAEWTAKKHKMSMEQSKNSQNMKTSDWDGDEDADNDPLPQHESLSKDNADVELEKASRTVFLANVSTAAITSKASKRELIKHLTSFPMPESNDPPVKVESLRFRSTAYSNAVPKRAAFARKELMDATTTSTNAYAVYNSNRAAREAAKKLNGTVVLGRHLRVDEVAHPAKVDNRRCVFVGNLGFVDEESTEETNADGETVKKKKPRKGDVEEGLWQQFGKAGAVENVRVVRDPKTRVGKGFAYVQFVDANAVETALLFNDKRFPPLLPRKLRVVRAKKLRRDGTVAAQPGAARKRPQKRADQSGAAAAAGNTGESALRGRVKKLLGRAGAAQMRSAAKPNGKPARAAQSRGGGGAVKPPESFVFEGHRASSTQGNKALKLGGRGAGKKKGGGKPNNRGTRRAAAWKSGSVKKSGGK